MAKLAFLGLEVMGYPMAGHLHVKGHEVTVCNRSASKAEGWIKEHGGSMARTPQEAVAGAQFVFACVGNDADLRTICIGPDGAFTGMTAATIFVDHTTISAAVTRDMCAAAAALHLGFVDAPVSGGQAGAEKGRAQMRPAPACR